MPEGLDHDWPPTYLRQACCWDSHCHSVWLAREGGEMRESLRPRLSSFLAEEVAYQGG